MSRLLALYCAPLLAMLAVGIVSIETGSTGSDGGTRSLLGEPPPGEYRPPSLHDSELVPRAPLFVSEMLRKAAHERALASSTVPSALLLNTPEPEPVALAQTAEPETQPQQAVAASAPTPEPVYVPLSANGCPTLIVESFPDPGAACAVARCESQFDPNAIGDHGSSLGYFQIQPRWHQAKADALFGVGANLLDPTVNVRVAYVISSGGTDWSQWTCKP